MFKSMVFPKEKLVFFKISLFALHIDFGSMFVPTCLYFSIKNPPQSHKKSIPRGIENLIDFRFHFPLIWASSWDPSWAHVGHFFRHRTPSRPTKKASTISPNAQNGPKCVLDPSRSPPDLDVGAPGIPFCSPRPRCWCPQRSIFKRFGSVPLLHYCIVKFALQTSILADL